MSDRIVVMDKGIFQQVGTPDEVYNRPKNEFVARFVGNANIIPGERGESLAIRTENILLDVPGGIEAVVKDKSFAGGLMRIELETTGGTTVVATRHGIDYAAEVGQTMTIGWEPKNAVVVEKE
jgi:spermidine/putrescine transport system ATP-binding protein